MTELKPTRVKNLSLPVYGLETLDWEPVEQALVESPAGPNRSWFLTTVRPDGRPHTVGIGAIWTDGAIYFTTGPDRLKTRNLAADPRCSVAAPIGGYDVTFEGEAHRVTDPAVLEAITARYRALGWPAEAEGDAVTAPFSAPSAGPGPWHLYRITIHAAVALKTEEPNGATKWWFR